MRSISLKFLGVVGLATIAFSGNGYAATCGIGDVTISSIDGGAVGPYSASNCAGIFDGNDSDLLTDLNSGDLFAGYTDEWTIFGKSDEAGSGVTAPEDTSGEWSVDFSPEEYSIFAVSLKGADSYGVWLFDLSEVGSLYEGGFTISFQNGGGQIPDLSHMTVAVYPTPVPIPPALALLGSGLGFLGLLGLRRRKSQSQPTSQA